MPSCFEALMNNALVTSSVPEMPSEVQQFAVAKDVSRYLNAVVGLARQAFPSSALEVCLGRDAEDEMHQYIAIDVDVSTLGTRELLSGQRIWSSGMGSACPSRDAVYFVLGGDE